MKILKYFLAILFLLNVCVLIVSAQTTIMSNGTGGGSWRDTLTWIGHVKPGMNDSVVIQAGDSVHFGIDSIQVTPESVYVQPSVPDTCYSLTILSGGKFAILAMTDTFGVREVVTLQANSILYQGGIQSAVPGTTRIIDHASTVIFTGGSAGSSVGETPGNLEFGNLIVRRPAGGATAAGDLIIHGDLRIQMALGNTFRGAIASNAVRTHHVYGNVYVDQGQWSCVDVGSDSTNCTWNVDGNVIATNATVDGARMMTFTSASAAGIAVFNIHGNLELNTGARLSAGSSSTRGYGKGIINLWGDFSMINGARTTTNHKGPWSINFVGTGTQTVKIDTNFNINQEPVFDTIAAGANVVFDLGRFYWSSMDTLLGNGGGAFVVNGTLTMKDTSRLQGRPSFTLNPGAKLFIGSKDGITQMPDSLHGNIRTTGTRSFSADADYEYYGSVAQVTGDGLPSMVFKLTVNNSAGVTLTNSTTVSDTLKLIEGDLYTEGNIVTLGEDGALNESDQNTVVGSIATTRTVTQGVDESFGGIGLTVNAAGASPGSTYAKRVTGIAQTFYSHSSILRYFDLTPTLNTGLNATLDYFYYDHELNGQNADALKLWKSTNTGSTWSSVSSTVNTGLKRLRAAGLESFSRFTAADTNNALDANAFTYHMFAKWNMISLPLIVTNSRKTSLFSTAASNAYAYTGGYAVDSMLDRGVGYWLKFPSEQDVNIYGTPFTSDTIELTEGWNMIGTISDTIETSGIVEHPPGIISSPFYGYNNGYTLSTILIPSRAYWVKAGPGGGTIILFASGVIGKHEVQDKNQIEKLNSLTFTSSDGSSQTLYLGSHGEQVVDMNRYELPPPPPPGILDARFTSQRYAEIYPVRMVKELEYGITLHAEAYPVTVTWNIVDGEKTFRLKGSTEATGISATLHSQGKFILERQTSGLSISVSEETSTPKQFAMSENYPNPFNPVTRINVELPAQSNISLRIFNLLGKEVAILASGTFDGGYHSFSWNGVNTDGIQVSSGVYFYKLEASSISNSQQYSFIRKMVFMK